MAEFSDPQLLRYSRHILLNELGVEGQTRLRDSHVLILGAGGLGSPAAMYLAAAGIGRITLVDGDAVDLTNLQRQIIHGTERIGQAKAQSGAQTLVALNPEVQVQPLAQRADAGQIDLLVAAADLVLDCSDNFATRHALNRACVAHARPLVSGAAIRFDGQLAVFDARRADSPCYECLFPAGAADDELCSVMGVFAPLTGIIGAMQAAEALKIAAGIGAPLTGRLLLLDALTMTLRSLTVPRDPQCAICGRH